MIENVLILSGADVAATAEATVAEVLRDRDPCPTVVIGPTTWQQPDPREERVWYFVIASGDRGGFFTVKISFGNDAELADRGRSAALVNFMMRRPIVVHDVDDELYMAQLCEAIWPCPKTSAIRAAIEAERARAAHRHDAPRRQARFPLVTEQPHE